jgi:hypothetical protein
MSSTTAKEKTMSAITNDNSARPPMITTEEYFGGCPHCGKTNGYRNAGRSHWFFCDDHRVIWHIGTNLFSSWQNETEAEQEEKWKHIENYSEVTPIYPDARDMHMASVVWHRTQARQHMHMAEEIEREHGLDPIEVAKQVDAEIESRRVAKAEPRALDADIPF